MKTDLKFDDYRTSEQRQNFYEGLSKEPSMGEKIKGTSQNAKDKTEEPTPLSGPNVRCFN